VHNVGVAGPGMTGATHRNVYARRRRDVRVVAVADPSPGRRAGRAVPAGNIEGQAKGAFAFAFAFASASASDFAGVRGYADGMDLVRDPDVSGVDVCLPTPSHRPCAGAAPPAGKHVPVEKPLARTAADAAAIAMPAMCMRFWPR